MEQTMDKLRTTTERIPITRNQSTEKVQKMKKTTHKIKEKRNGQSLKDQNTRTKVKENKDHTQNQ